MTIKTKIPQPEASVPRSIEALKRALKELGPSIATAFEPVIEGLQATIIATIQETYWTITQVQSFVSSQLGSYSTTSQMNSAISNAVSSPGDISPSSVSSSGTIAGNVVKTASGPSTNITGTRVASWLQSSDGTIGTASSSQRYKQDIVPAAVDVKKILQIEVDYFHYIDEVRKRDDPTFDGYVGPSYPVALNIGVIAEQLHSLGLWEAVVYQREPMMVTRTVPQTTTADDGSATTEQVDVEVVVGDQLKLDTNGDPIPDGVHYELLALYCLEVVQDHETRLAALEKAALT